jgi:hypothetical protein
VTDELKKYLLEQCRAWMLPEELRALRRSNRFITYHDEIDRQIASTDPETERYYGFKDEKTNVLVALGIDKLETLIAERLLKEPGHELLNYCPKCHGLARTPYAKQCRHCGYDWH